jgi:hypothetical protein
MREVQVRVKEGWRVFDQGGTRKSSVLAGLVSYGATLVYYTYMTAQLQSFLAKTPHNHCNSGSCRLYS